MLIYLKKILIESGVFMEKTRVLIVDDSIFSVSILRDILEENGFEVVGDAANLEEVKKEVSDKKPDLVTMDMTLIGTDGLECTREIKKIDSNIKVIIASSMMDDEIVKKAKRAGASGYVQKPIESEELITTIKRIFASEDLYVELKQTYMDLFKESLSNNLNRLTKTIPDYTEEVRKNETEQSRGVSIVVGIIGKFAGRMLMDLSKETAENISKIAIKRDPKNMEETLQILGEFANIVAGNACSYLNRKNKLYGFRVSPPAIFHGSSLNISKSSMEIITVICKTQLGEIFFNVGFQRSEE